uniref:USP6 N-terminal like n=1 Tax=Gorilla gorilla gorilla TaxID=9595 RepID=G3RMK4_GORGO
MIQVLQIVKELVTPSRQKAATVKEDGVLPCHPGWSAVAQSRLTASSTSW